MRYVARLTISAWIPRCCRWLLGNISELALTVERGAIPRGARVYSVHNDYALQALADMGAEGLAQLRATPPRDLSPGRNASIPVGYMVSGRGSYHDH